MAAGVQVLRSGGGDEETAPEHLEAGEGLAASTVGEARDGGIKFKTYRYKGLLPSDRFILGRELLAAIIAAVGQDVPPRHLVLGAFGYEAVAAKLRERLAAIEAARDISLGADFPADAT